MTKAVIKTMYTCNLISEISEIIMIIVTYTFCCSFIELFFVNKFLLVGASVMLWAGGSWISGSAMYVCHTNQIRCTIKHQSNFLL